MRFVVLLVAALLASNNVVAAGFTSRDDAVALTDQIMRKVSSGDMRGGLGLAKPYVVIPDAELDAMIGQAELQMPVMSARFGKSIGYELIRNDSVGDSLTQVLYLQRFEKHATVWRFILYHGSNGWVLNTFNFVDDIKAAF